MPDKITITDYRRMTEAEERAVHDITFFDHVFYSDGKGTLTYMRDKWAPENPTMYCDEDRDEDIFSSVKSEGWTPLAGFTGQWGYNGPVMHASEDVGGGLLRHMLETEGYYVTMSVEVMGEEDEYGDATREDEAAGWCILYRETF